MFFQRKLISALLFVRARARESDRLNDLASRRQKFATKARKSHTVKGREAGTPSARAPSAVQFASMTRVTARFIGRLHSAVHATQSYGRRRSLILSVSHKAITVPAIPRGGLKFMVLLWGFLSLCKLSRYSSPPYPFPLSRKRPRPLCFPRGERGDARAGSSRR